MASNLTQPFGNAPDRISEFAGNSKPPAHDSPLEVSVSIRKELSSGFCLEVQFTVHPGISILFGASGAGKTTLLDCIAGLCRPDSGTIDICGHTVFDSKRAIDVPTRYRNVGHVFQDLALFPHLDVEGNVGYGLQRTSAKDRTRRTNTMLETLGISHLRSRRPAELSGGERQRVALARALVTEPAILLLDEPLAALDLPVRTKIADDLRASIQDRPIPVLYVTHSRDEVFTLGNDLLLLERGRLIAKGSPHSVLSAPRAETVAQLAGFENIFDVVVASIHEERGTMTCSVVPMERSAAPDPRRNAVVEFETPLVRAQPGEHFRLGVSAGDILLSTSAPVGLSARNALPGKLVSLSQRDAIIVPRVDCGVELFVHLTLGARDSLQLTPGRQVWAIVKTHSCHLLS